MAFTPHALTFSGNNTTDIQEMQIQDATGILSFQQFIGGTILRTIVDIVLSPTYQLPPGPNFTSEMYWHLGMFLTEDANPNLSTRWDPNVPHGDFMLREMAVETWYHRVMASGVEIVKHESSHGQRMHWDTTVKRRIHEDERMWMAGRYFTLLATGSAIGYTGRLLIQLP